jgi:glycosyltransferase involved in cell wall biosynthesis
VGGIPEIILDGVSGILVPPRSPKAIAKALTTLIEDRGKATQYGSALKKKVSEEFSLDRMVQETTNVYSRNVDNYVIDNNKMVPK